MSPETQTLKRPACFDFFLSGSPAGSELRAYVEQLEARAALTQPAQPAEGGEAVYQIRRIDGSWYDAPEGAYRMGVELGADNGRVLYAAPPASHVPEADFGNNQPASQEPKGLGMGTQDLAGELAEALNKDTQSKNSLGMLGQHTMAWLRKVATEYLRQPASQGQALRPISEQDATLLNQAHDMLLDHADEQRHKGNDSAALGAKCSADAVLRLGAQAASQEQAQPPGVCSACVMPEQCAVDIAERGPCHGGVQKPSGGGDVLVYAYWPNGERKLLQFHDWPLRHQLPADAVRFDIAWPDEALRNKAPQCPPA